MAIAHDPRTSVDPAPSPSPSPAAAAHSARAAAAQTAASGPLLARDLLSSGVRIGVELAPLVVPDRDVVVRAVRDVIATGADARAGRLFAGNRWTYDPAHLDAQAERIVRALPAEFAGDEGLPRLREITPDDLPFAVFLGEDRASLCIDHRIGDGFISVMLTAAALAGRGVPAVFRTADDTDPLPAALSATFVRQPERVRALLGDRWRERRARPTPGAGVPAERGSLDLVTGTMDASTFKTLAAWSRGRVAPTLATMFALRTALERVGIPVAEEGGILVDLRRYLPSGRSTLANFVVGHPVSTAKGIDDAGARLSRDLHVGRPLAALTAGLATRALPRRAPRRVPAAATPIVSDMGFLRALEPLPWADGDPVVRVSVDPAGRNGITALTAVLRGRLHVSVSFDGTLYDRDTVAQACELLCRDPKELLP